MKPNDSYKSVKTAPGRNTGRLNRNNSKVLGILPMMQIPVFIQPDLGRQMYIEGKTKWEYTQVTISHVNCKAEKKMKNIN
ncbi:hypothetical protein MASR2M47_00730 [Draconibacterium sp.]